MTTSRKDVFTPEVEGYYHCISRCVRRAFLCGKDPVTSRSFEHRREWIRTRLRELLEIFAIKCLAYAVMDNHLHTLLKNLPSIAASWSPEEIAKRWLRLFPRRRSTNGSPKVPSDIEILSITSNPERVELYRLRLSDISWLQRCLNEHIARRANAEDNCKGRFWEGRFKSQPLTTEAALLACSVYVDLNAIRAGSAKTPETSDYTSVQDRIRCCVNKEATPALPLLSHGECVNEDLTEHRYIELVDEVGRVLVSGKSHIAPHLEPILARIGLTQRGLILNAKSQSKLFRRVVGSVQSIRALALAKGKRWFQGMAAAQIVFG